MLRYPRLSQYRAGLRVKGGRDRRIGAYFFRVGVQEVALGTKEADMAQE